MSDPVWEGRLQALPLPVQGHHHSSRMSFAEWRLRSQILLTLLFLATWGWGVYLSIRWIDTLVSPWAWAASAAILLGWYGIAVWWLARNDPSDSRHGWFRAGACWILLLIFIVALVLSYAFALVLLPIILILLVELPRRSAVTASLAATALSVFLYWPYYDWAPPNFLPVVLGTALIGAVLIADSAVQVIRDSRERLRKAVRDLIDTQQRLTAVEARSAVLQDRSLIAADIHDAIAQNSLALTMLLTRLRTMPGQPDGFAGLLLESEILARETLQEARRLVRSLGDADKSKPAPFVLSAEMRQICASYRKRARSLDLPIEVELDIDGAADSSSFASGVAILHASHVFLANVMLHSSATCVRVSVTADSEFVTLCVSDDGVGVDEGAVDTTDERFESTGYGLQLLRTRLQSLGGAVDIDSVLGQGTTAFASAPLR